MYTLPFKSAAVDSAWQSMALTAGPLMPVSWQPFPEPITPAKALSCAGANCNWPTRPMPVTAAVCGELAALSATVRYADNAPATVLYV
jgi:hypothetical protein